MIFRRFCSILYTESKRFYVVSILLMKRFVYILSFTLLGILLQFVVHGAFELPVIYFLKKDFARYGLGFSWSDWFLAHHIFTVVLFVLGIGLGLFAGFRFWKIVYGRKS